MKELKLVFEKSDTQIISDAIKDIFDRIIEEHFLNYDMANQEISYDPIETDYLCNAVSNEIIRDCGLIVESKAIKSLFENKILPYYKTYRSGLEFI